MGTLHTQVCPVAEFLNVFGDAWTLMLVREAFTGTTRFSDFERNTGIAKNVLSSKLSKLTHEGIIERTNVGNRGTRFEYHLTEKGRALAPVLHTIQLWSNKHIFGEGNEPVLVVEKTSGEVLRHLEFLSQSGHGVDWDAVRTMPGPGASS